MPKAKRRYAKPRQRGTYAYESAPVVTRKRKAAKKRQEETMRKLGDVSVATALWFAGVSFALVALWTWYNYVRP